MLVMDHGRVTRNNLFSPIRECLNGLTPHAPHVPLPPSLLIQRRGSAAMLRFATKHWSTFVSTPTLREKVYMKKRDTVHLPRLSSSEALLLNSKMKRKTSPWTTPAIAKTEIVMLSRPGKYSEKSLWWLSEGKIKEWEDPDTLVLGV